MFTALRTKVLHYNNILQTNRISLSLFYHLSPISRYDFYTEIMCLSVCLVTDMRSAHLILINCITHTIFCILRKLLGFPLSSFLNCTVISSVMLFLCTELNPLTTRGKPFY
jgi:hypothetical protein